MVLSPKAKLVLMTQQNGVVFESNTKGKLVRMTQQNGAALESSNIQRRARKSFGDKMATKMGTPFHGFVCARLRNEDVRVRQWKLKSAGPRKGTLEGRVPNSPEPERQVCPYDTTERGRV